MPDPSAQTVPPVEPTVPVAAPTAAASVAVAPAAPAATAGDPPLASVVAAPPIPVEPPKKDWKDDRIAELTAKLHEERKKHVVEANPQRTGESPEAFEARVNEEAGRIASATEWARQCNEVIAQGKAKYTDWQPQVDNIRKLVDTGDQVEVFRYNTFLAAAIETGEAPQLLYDLAKNPGEAKRLMGLSPVKQAQALATMVATAKTALPLSAAPAPITPISSHGAHLTEIAPDDAENGMNLPKADWFTRRDKQAEERGLQ